jgi:hypothetical protein
MRGNTERQVRSGDSVGSPLDSTLVDSSLTSLTSIDVVCACEGIAPRAGPADVRAASLDSDVSRR